MIIISLPQKKKKIGVSHVNKGRVASDTNNHYKDVSKKRQRACTLDQVDTTPKVHRCGAFLRSLLEIL